MYCVMCNTTDRPFLTPLKCLTKWGPDRSHKICQTCWFRDFAKELGTHECPGCLSNVPVEPKARYIPDEKKECIVINE